MHMYGSVHTQIDMYVYIFYAWVLNSVLCHQYTSTCTCIYRCVLYMYMYILYMQALNECHAVIKFVSCRLTSVYMYLHAYTVPFVCTHMDVCMYNVHIHSLHAGAQGVSRSDRVCVRQVDVCIHVSTCMYCAVCTWTYACKCIIIYILYMQVLKECLAVTEFVSGRLMSVYMYLHACTVQFVHGRMHVNV